VVAIPIHRETPLWMKWQVVIQSAVAATTPAGLPGWGAGSLCRRTANIIEAGYNPCEEKSLNG